MKMPNRHKMPPGMDYVAILVETGWPPSEIDRLPFELIEEMVIYRNVKKICEHGGEYNP